MVTVVVSGPTLKREFIKRGFVMPRLSSSFNSTGSVLTTCWAVNCYGSLSSPGASDRRSILWPAVLISGRVGHLVSLHMYILHSITVHVYIRPNRGKWFVILYSSQPLSRNGNPQHLQSSFLKISNGTIHHVRFARLCTYRTLTIYIHSVPSASVSNNFHETRTIHHVDTQPL